MLVEELEKPPRKKMTTINRIHWFRQDLRISDNPSLLHALEEDSCLAIYIFDDQNPGDKIMGSASKLWLHHALKSLDLDLGNKLSIYKGDPEVILLQLCEQYKIKHVSWNRCYEPWRITRDRNIKEKLSAKHINATSFNGSLLWEPWEINKDDGTPFKVFTPFYQRGCLKSTPPRQPQAKPGDLLITKDHKFSIELQKLDLLPKINWDHKLISNWAIGEQAAHKRLNNFLLSGISNYKEGRNFPAKKYVSRLSIDLHYGHLSPNQIWYKIKDIEESKDTSHFCSELGWREFSYNLLYNNPDLATENLQKKFDAFPWEESNEYLTAWQQGKTGIPMVDAGMRELWQTGYMHNRVRMIVGSFLVKNLLIDWRHGEQWFWDCLFDADYASNSASWQWIAGCGADAAPYFRIFNPVTQGEKFDPSGEYIKKYIPELKNLPLKYLYSPWEASQELLQAAGVHLGKNYPKPIVELKSSREKALAAFSTLKQANNG